MRSAIRVVGEATIDPLTDAVLDQFGVAVERGAEEDFPGKKQHHELRRGLKLGPVGLAGEIVDVLPELPRVIDEPGVARRRVVGFQRCEIRRQRDFGIDDDVLATGQLYHHVGTVAAVFVGDRHLFLEITVVRACRRSR